MIRAKNVKVKTWTKKTYDYKDAIITRTNLGVLVGGDTVKPGTAKQMSKWFPKALIKSIQLNGEDYDFKTNHKPQNEGVQTTR